METLFGAIYLGAKVLQEINNKVYFSLEELHGSKSLRDNQRVILWGQIKQNMWGRQLCQGQLSRGQLIRRKSPQNKSPGGIFMRGNCPEVISPGGNYSRVIKVWGVVVLGEIHRRQLSGDSYTRGNYSEVIVQRGNCPGGIS